MQVTETQLKLVRPKGELIGLCKRTAGKARRLEPDSNADRICFSFSSVFSADWSHLQTGLLYEVRTTYFMRLALDSFELACLISPSERIELFWGCSPRPPPLPQAAIWKILERDS